MKKALVNFSLVTIFLISLIAPVFSASINDGLEPNKPLKYKKYSSPKGKYDHPNDKTFLEKMGIGVKKHKSVKEKPKGFFASIFYSIKFIIWDRIIVGGYETLNSLVKLPVPWYFKIFIFLTLTVLFVVGSFKTFVTIHEIFR